MAENDDPKVRRLIGLDTALFSGLDLPENWTYQIIAQVGNYAECYDRNLGQDSPLKIERGLNALWMDGGILYAPPLR